MSRASPPITKAVKGKLKILADSGIRSGLDIARMIALGADAVLLGRAFVYALAADGQKGVENVLSLMEKELRVAMTLMGASTIADITPDSVARLDATEV
ncbi:MAG: alpha-hydroxy-acid oxidizing protein [Acetobacter cibinongensis]